MTIRILENCTIFDGHSDELIEGGSIVIENDRIREIADANAKLNDADRVDMGGHFVMPGLLKGTLHRSYTTVFISGGVASPTDPVWMPQWRPHGHGDGPV